jgi:hypothetical protein
MPDRKYTNDFALREALAELLQEHHYAIEGFGLADKPVEGDEMRTLTLKASRSLTFEQQRLGIGESK